MVKARKLGFGGLIALVAGTVISTLTGSANAGNCEIKHYSTQTGIGKEAVVIEDNTSDGSYLPLNDPKLTAIIQDINSPQLGKKSIDPDETTKTDIYFGAQNVTSGINQSIRVRFVNSNMADYATRNLTLKQDPNDLNAEDPNLYDILDLTDYGTAYGYITLPLVTNPEPQRKFILWSGNYADLNFDGKVNFNDFAIIGNNWGRIDCDSTNHWGNYSDLNRDGLVGISDLFGLSEQWLYNTNDPNTL